MAMQMSTNGLKEQTLAEIRNIRDEYPDARSALLPALRLVQREYGWLPESAFDEVAAILDLPPTYVASVASFYTMFHQEPVGRHVIWVCTNISCSLLGAEHLLDYLSRKLGIAVGETTPDGRWTLLEAECLGACGGAPVMQVDEAYYEHLTEAEIDRILDEASG